MDFQMYPKIASINVKNGLTHDSTISPVKKIYNFRQKYPLPAKMPTAGVQKQTNLQKYFSLHNGFRIHIYTQNFAMDFSFY